MEQIGYTQAAGLMKLYGRTWSDGEVLHFNWTCSGFEVLFHGKCLTANFVADYSIEIEGSLNDVNAPRHESWPWVGVFLDGSELPSRRFEVNAPRRQELLFASAQAETHRIRVVKLTENFKTYLGLSGFSLDGHLLPLPQEAPKKMIEFIGDSITCGFSNETRERDRCFFTQDENGWLAHGPVAARQLGMDWSMISISGICLGPREEIPMQYAAKQLYCDTDRPGQEKAGQPVTHWDFSANPVDYIVLNLGTNDANAISASIAPEAVEAQFDKDYLEFLHILRQCHGPATHIICAMGSMDYYLYPNILKNVKTYQQKTGDDNISCLRYMRISPFDPLGGCSHPYLLTHQKMANTLAAHIQEVGRL